MNKPLSTLFALAVAFATAAVHAQEIKGDAKAGERKNAACIGCHGIAGYQASFPEIYKVPKISGQSAKYISNALAAYKKGERKHPTMRGNADSLSDQDMADLAAYYSTHGVKEGDKLPETPTVQPSTQVAELIKKGACVSCHGANFSKPIDPSYPKLAGQHADSLYVALKSYKTDGNATWGRSNGIMGGIAKQFSNSELKAMANYMASLPGDLKTIPEAKFR
jgi:cytochrome c553